ncbi:DUF2524 family protein [Alkalihalobacillus sp. LMS39]|uniref:DUF2524 family protein n=1 Tax=Alkalihalobacillus sp. LMS39 TaxID=2924032 RepID=UPI001FB20ACF|nr:DUF2524 family protein [Alkalihalobacillus sp. LMS39]UOE92284.1 YtzC family protein [Alkalihalobacillus sp. LMS39]
MAIHEQVNQFVEKANETIELAQQQLDLAKRVEAGDPEDYSEAQLKLEEINDELNSLIRSATPEQRDQLHRAQQRVSQMQNNMILKR